ncbi:MAG: response regulator [Candidatus Heimdallarchaeota archaeon]
MKPTVLFVDDEVGVRNTVRRFFQFQQKFEIDFAANGQEALRKLQEQEYQILVTDHIMPEMTGEELLQHVQEEFPDTIRVILTAYGTLDLATRAMNELGVFGFLQKPVKRKKLFEMLDKAAARYQENMRVQQLLKTYGSDIPPVEWLENLRVILARWDEHIGPEVLMTFPSKLSDIDVERVTTQTFMGFVPIYGHEGDTEPAQITLPFHYLKMEGRIHFDATRDSAVRGGQRRFAVIVIAPTMHANLAELIGSCLSDFASAYRHSQSHNLSALLQCIQAKLVGTK